MSKTLNIRKESLINIVSRILSSERVYQPLNFKHIKNLVLDNMSDNVLENVLELMLAKEPYELVYPGDLVKVTAPSYHEGSKYEKDVLKDMSLLSDDDDMVYAKVISDNNWSTSSKYNPLYTQLKIEYLYHDENKNIKYTEDTVCPFNLYKLEVKEQKQVIKAIENQLKTKENAKIITSIDHISI